MPSKMPRSISLLAENERHRIGRDLHDSLGHTFAMLSVKADLADQFLALGQVEKAQEQVQEIQAISQESMHQVREIVENLKQRTLAREARNRQANAGSSSNQSRDSKRA